MLTLKLHLMRHLIRYIVIAILVIAGFHTGMAQTVRYLHKPLSPEGCHVEYNVSKQDSSYFIIATVTSDRLIFLDNPTMKIRTFKDDVITLEGDAIGNRNGVSFGYSIGYVGVSESEIKSTAQFYITPDVFLLLKDGVAKVRLSMRPMNHEREFKKDKIGAALYQLYLDAKDQDDNF